jgi:tryptophan halogenase
VDFEYDRVRDFLILHYHATTRSDSSFWDHVRTMQVPDSLAEKLELFRRAGRIQKYSEGLFFEPSWLSVYIGQNVIPQGWDQRADAVESRQLERALDKLRAQVAASVEQMPEHGTFLRGRNQVPASAGLA